MPETPSLPATLALTAPGWVSAGYFLGDTLFEQAAVAAVVAGLAAATYLAVRRVAG